MWAEADRPSDPGEVRMLLRSAGLQAGPAQACAYLPGRAARFIAFRARPLPAGLYHSLMDLNFRRCGDVFYRPSCDGCRECRAVRVPVETFRPDRTQRRCWKHNRDLAVQVGPPEPTEEKHALYQRYLAARHDGRMTGEWADFHEFLYHSPIETQEVTFRVAGRLVGVGILDIEPAAASTVYCWFDPGCSRRSLGMFNILWTIDYCLSRGIPHVYLGYAVRGCPKMIYKTRFRPCEWLDDQDVWRPAGGGLMESACPQ